MIKMKIQLLAKKINQGGGLINQKHSKVYMKWQPCLQSRSRMLQLAASSWIYLIGTETLNSILTAQDLTMMNHLTTVVLQE